MQCFPFARCPFKLACVSSTRLLSLFWHSKGSVAKYLELPFRSAIYFECVTFRLGSRDRSLEADKYLCALSRAGRGVGFIDIEGEFPEELHPSYWPHPHDDLPLGRL